MGKTNQNTKKISIITKELPVIFMRRNAAGHAAISPASSVSALPAVLAAVVPFRPANAVFTPGRVSVGVWTHGG